MPLDCAPVDRAISFGVAAASAMHDAANETNTSKHHHNYSISGTSWINEKEDKEKDGIVERRSILVRDLPRNLGAEEATESLRKLFSEAAHRPGLVKDLSKGIQAPGVPPPVAASQRPMPQSSWRSNRRYAHGCSREAAAHSDLAVTQRNHLLQQLPYAVSSIRVAADQRGGSIYAIVDFSHATLADLALELLGQSVALPGTLS